MRRVLTASLALGGCVTLGAQEKESQLAAAGFVRLQADTPQKAAKLQALPQNTIVYAQRKRGNAYIYADAAGCNCAYVGNDAAYQQYQQLRAANNIAQMQETTALAERRSGERLGRRVGADGALLVLIEACETRDYESVPGPGSRSTALRRLRCPQRLQARTPHRCLRTAGPITGCGACRSSC